ncbi:MAG TPA: GSU2403 family nucleotidyltransferase fold protein [Thermoanaerobaculia bacterium]|nr:GSU2403 family nucleotidyltransferase fold protein [Thermoanaerobaculia bacterium]
MSPSGGADLLVLTRGVLLDALEALAEHREAVVVIGAQAIYLRTGAAEVALAEMTKDSDLALDPRALAREPLIEEAMRAAGFELQEQRPQPGTWVGRDGIPVDLMVPAALSGPGGHRGGRIPPHSNRATRRAAGLEAAMVDRSRMEIRSLTQGDDRAFATHVAGPAALLVSKLHKLSERENQSDRLADKDAHDIYRLLQVPTDELVATFSWLIDDPLAGGVTRDALEALERLFASGPEALGSMMAGRAEAGVGAPEVVSASVAVLAADLLAALDRRRER